MNVGKHAVLVDAYKDGSPAIAIWSGLRTIHRRVDGTFFWVIDGRRETITKRDDGTFYLKLNNGVPT